MFHHILVPLDGSALAECVLPHMAALAQIGKPKITFLKVLDPTDVSTARPIDPVDWQIRKAETDAYLREVTARARAIQVDAEPQVLEGKAASAIIEYARENRVDLILLSSHGESGITGWNVSSVVQKIILRARTSIMIVRAYQPAVGDPGELVYKRILLPLDGSSRAEVVLPVAAAIAQRCDSELIAVHVVQKPPMPRRMPPTEEDVQLLERFAERNRAEAYEYLTNLPERLDARLDFRLLVEDSVTGALHSIVETENADLVVLSAHGYTGEARYPYGSVVISFISYGTTPLLVVQDLPFERFESTQAEIAAQEQGRR